MMDRDAQDAERACQIAGDLARAVISLPAPLDDERWRAFERVRTGGARRRRPPSFVWALGLAVLAAVVWWRATLVDRGQLFAAPAGHDVVATLPDGCVLRLRAGSRAHLRTEGRRGAPRQLSIEEGRIELSVGDGHRAPWELRAGPFRVVPRRGRFEVRWSPTDSRFEAYVFEGEISVRDGGPRPEAVIRSGQRYPAPPPPATTVSPPPKPPTALPDVPVRAEPPRHGEPRKSASATWAEAPAPALPDHRSPLLDAGGAECTGPQATWSFDDGVQGFQPLQAVRRLETDRERSWCGGGSLAAEVEFTMEGPRDDRNLLPFQRGHIVLKLARPLDLTGKTIRAHLLVDADPRLHFGAGIYVRSHGKKVQGPWLGWQSPRGWMDLRHTYGAENRAWEGGEVTVDAVDELGISIWVEGQDRVWSARVYLDELEVR